MASDCTGLVLVVEDEEALSRLTRRVLEQAGFETLTALDGDIALALVAEHGDRITSLVVDVGIRPMGAQALLHEMITSTFKPSLVLTSGAACPPELQHFMEEQGGRFLPKPFSPADLKHAVQNGLAE